MFYDIFKYAAIGLMGCGLLLAGVAIYMNATWSDKLLLPLAMISLGIGTILIGIHGLFSGQISTRHGYISRNERPFFYWSLLLLSQLGGLTVTGFGIAFLISFQ